MVGHKRRGRRGSQDGAAAVGLQARDSSLGRVHDADRLTPSTCCQSDSVRSSNATYSPPATEGTPPRDTTPALAQSDVELAVMCHGLVDGGLDLRFVGHVSGNCDRVSARLLQPA